MDNSDYEVDPLDVLAPLPTTSFSPSPVFHAKGNSLFAELDDHRQVVESKYSTLINRYDRLSQLYQQLEAERNLLEEQYRSRLTELTVRSAQASALEEIRRQHQACVQECDSLRDQLQRLRNELTEEKRLRKELEIQTALLKDQIASFSRSSTGDSGSSLQASNNSIKNTLFRSSCNRPQCLTMQGHVQQLEKDLKKQSTRADAAERQLWTLQAELNAQRIERGNRDIECKQLGIDLEDERSRVKQLLLRLQRIAIEGSSVAHASSDTAAASSSNPFLAALSSIRTISSLSASERAIIGLGSADENSSAPVKAQKASVEEPVDPKLDDSSSISNNLSSDIISSAALPSSHSSGTTSYVSDNPFLIGLRGIFVAPPSGSLGGAENKIAAGKSLQNECEGYQVMSEKTAAEDESTCVSEPNTDSSPSFEIAGAARVSIADHEPDAVGLASGSSPPIAVAAQLPLDQKPKRFLWREKLLLPRTSTQQPPY